MKKYGVVFLLLCCTVFNTTAQKKLLRITVSAGEQDHQNHPVSIRLDESLGDIRTGVFRLMEQVTERPVEIPFQVINDKAGGRHIYWLINGDFPRNSIRVYELESAEPQVLAAHQAVMYPSKLDLNNVDGKPLLTYQHGVYPVPEGVDPIYARSGFIHPLRTPSGNVLTRIQPPDHVHHYGLWNPWTQLEYNGAVYDLWNLHQKQGCVRFSIFEKIASGAVFSGFTAVHDHLIYAATSEEKVLEELWSVLVFPQHETRYLCDIRSDYNLSGQHDIRLRTHRYGGGLGLRLREDWTPATSTLYTSAGKTREDADGSVEKWVLIQGALDEENGGILLMASAQNPDFPEPVRVWPPDANNGKGDIMFNFSPIKNKDWLMRLGESYRLEYRLVVFDGIMTTEEAEQLWLSYTHPPKIITEKIY